MSNNEDNIPVIVGVGQINDRPENPLDGLNSVELMAEALKAADQDAGGNWLDDADTLLVVANLSFAELGNPLPLVAELLDIAPAIQRKSSDPKGDSPIRFLNEAANAILAGDSTIALVTGGEALVTAGAQAKAAVAAGKPPPPNALAAAAAAGTSPRIKYGLGLPTHVYALYENAMRADRGLSIDEAQQESADLWSGMSQVAAANDDAWIRDGLDAAAIRTPAPHNRMVAFPYTKLMVANAAVNQGAAFIVTSLSEARRRGVPEDRLVYVGYGAAAHEPDEVLDREALVDSRAIRATMTEVLAENDLTVEAIDKVEFYSCFPAVPKMAMRAIGWPSGKPITVTGGLTFSGGPIGNFMSHAVAKMVEQLRGSDEVGLLFANGGYATTSHAIIVSGDIGRAATEARDFDVQAKADAGRGEAPSYIDTFDGPGVIESYTINYGRDGSPSEGLIVGRSPDASQRFLAVVPGDDQAGIDRLLGSAGEPIGSSGEVKSGQDGRNVWKFAG